MKYEVRVVDDSNREEVLKLKVASINRHTLKQ